MTQVCLRVGTPVHLSVGLETLCFDGEAYCVYDFVRDRERELEVQLENLETVPPRVKQQMPERGYIDEGNASYIYIVRSVRSILMTSWGASEIAGE